MLVLASTARADVPACRLRIAGSAPLRIDDGFITLRATVNGRNASLLVDTGSERGLLLPQAVAALGLRPDPSHRTRLQGTGGAGRTVPNALLPGIGIDGLVLPGGSVPVGPLPAMPVIAPAVAGLIGADVLNRFDLELDLRRGRILFWEVRLGSLLCAPPPAWTGAFNSVPMRMEDGRPVLGATLDGRPVSTLLDSGARSRVVSVRAAARAGVGADVLGADPGGIEAGVDGRERAYHWHRFASLAIGAERIARPVLTVAPLGERFDLLLGADWFAGRDVWVSQAAGMVFTRE